MMAFQKARASLRLSHKFFQSVEGRCGITSPFLSKLENLRTTVTLPSCPSVTQTGFFQKTVEPLNSKLASENVILRENLGQSDTDILAIGSRSLVKCCKPHHVSSFFCNLSSHLGRQTKEYGCPLGSSSSHGKYGLPYSYGMSIYPKIVSTDPVTNPVISRVRKASTKATSLSDNVTGKVEKDVCKEKNDVYKTAKQTGRRQSNAHHIGYRVLEKLNGKLINIETQNVFAVVQIGSHQFKVSPGDAIYVEKLKFVDVNEKVALEKVMLLGSKWQTIIGRPVIPGAHVLAAVEEQALDAKVIIFKKKRRKNYRRHKGHRQELTRLRILNIVGIAESPEMETKTETEKETETEVKEPMAAVV